MKYLQYQSTTGHTILSPKDISYAMTTHLRIDPAKLLDNDLKECTMVPNESVAALLQILMQDRGYCDAQELLSGATYPDRDPITNSCVLENGSLFIRRGEQYVALSNFTQKATKAELKIALNRIALQAAVCHAELCKIAE